MHYANRPPQTDTVMSEPKSEYEVGTDDSEPTPGPWASIEPGSNVYYIMTDDGVEIARVSAPGQRFDETKANAELIAAAGTAASELPSCKPTTTDRHRYE